MFYCNNCAKQEEYPTTILKSYERCEICNKCEDCNELSSGYLLHWTGNQYEKTNLLRTGMQQRN